MILEDREASPSMSSGLLLSAIVVENVQPSGLFITVIRTGSQVLQVNGQVGELGDVDRGVSRRHMRT